MNTCTECASTDLCDKATHHTGAPICHTCATAQTDDMGIRTYLCPHSGETEITYLARLITRAGFPAQVERTGGNCHTLFVKLPTGDRLAQGLMGDTLFDSEWQFGCYTGPTDEDCEDHAAYCRLCDLLQDICTAHTETYLPPYDIDDAVDQIVNLCHTLTRAAQGTRHIY